MHEAFSAIVDEDGFPRAKIHGLRMLRSDIVTAFPFASCDSTNATQNGTRKALQIGAEQPMGSELIAHLCGVQSPERYTPRREMQLEFSLTQDADA